MGPWSSRAGQRRGLDELQRQWQTLSQRLKWSVIEEDIGCWPQTPHGLTRSELFAHNRSHHLVSELQLSLDSYGHCLTQLHTSFHCLTLVSVLCGSGTEPSPMDARQTFCQRSCVLGSPFFHFARGSPNSNSSGVTLQVRSNFLLFPARGSRLLVPLGLRLHQGWRTPLRGWGCGTIAFP